jgi:hypothetical protein
MLGTATRRSGATARSRNTAGDRFPGLPGGFDPEGRIAALRRLHRGPPCAARRALRYIPSGSNATPTLTRKPLSASAPSRHNLRPQQLHKLRQPLRMRRPGRGRHEILIRYRPVQWKINIFPAREPDFRRARGVG